MTYRPMLAKLPRSTLCSYHKREHQVQPEVGTGQNGSEATGEDEADSEVNSVA